MNDFSQVETLDLVWMVLMAEMERRVPKLSDGDKVPRTGLYRLDKGARVIPVAQLKREAARKKSRGGRR